MWWSDVRKEMAGINTNETKARFAFAMLNEVLSAFQSPRFNQAIALVKEGRSRHGA